MKDLVIILPILVATVLLWFTYSLVNFVYTIIKAKKTDTTMVCGLSSTGKVFYGVLTVAFLAEYVFCAYFIITHILSGDIDAIYMPLNILTISSLVVNYLVRWIIYFGHRQVLIGSIIFDYRKIKRVTYPKRTKLRFVYGQRTLETNIRFIDESLLKKSLQKSR